MRFYRLLAHARLSGQIAGSVLLLLLGAGCQTVTPQIRDEYARTIPKCSTDAECHAKMEAAQVFLSQTLSWKIQTATDALIQTYGPGSTEASTAAVVTKQPTGDGTYQIIIRAWCNNPLGCFPAPWEVAINFNRYVNNVHVQEPAPEVRVSAASPPAASIEGLSVGTVLYERNGVVLGAIDQVDPTHAFDDGSYDAAVRVKLAAGGMRWFHVGQAREMVKTNP